MSLASFWCRTCGAGYHAHEIHECKAVWRVVAPDGREWRNPRLMAAVAAAIEETKLQFPAGSTDGVVVVQAPSNGEPFRSLLQEALEYLCGDSEFMQTCRAALADGVMGTFNTEGKKP